MLVQDWMTRDPITIEAETPFLEARLILRERHIRHLPVVDHGQLVGVVTDRDLKEAAPSGATTLDVYEMNYLLLKMKVRDLIKRSPITVRPTSSVEEAARLMQDHKIGCLPVTDEAGMLVGLLTETDLLRAIVDILGYTEKGTRITFQAPDSPEICREVAETLHAFPVELRNLATWALPAPAGLRGFVVRVRGKEVDRLIQALRARYGEAVRVQST